MHTKTWALLAAGLTAATSVSAADNFFDDLIVSEEMKQKQVSESSKFEAGKLLDSKPKILRVDRKKMRLEKVEPEKAAPIIREPAPLGLKWLATVDEIKYLNVRLTPVELKDMPNSYLAENLPTPVSAFREIILSFGENDALWRIAAYGKFIEDDSAASKALKEYRKYYQILEKKYGNAHQFYTPAVLNVDTDDGTTSSREMDIGEDGFLQKLMSGETTLYATFENGKVGVTLALSADGNGQTFIIVDYKNLSAGKQEIEELYNAL